MEEDLSVLSRKANAPDEVITYGEHQDQIADIRYARVDHSRPLLVLIHGGFWKPEYDREHTEAMSSALSELGWTVLTLEYRRIPGQPDLLVQDIAAALRELPTKVKKHDGRVILIGHSAGGHLALWAATQNLDVHAVLALAPAADLQLADSLNLGENAVRRFLGTEPASRPDLDPMMLAVPKANVMILQGKADEIVPPSVPLAYKSRFPAVSYEEIDECGHFALIDPQTQAWQSVVDTLNQLSESSDVTL